MNSEIIKKNMDAVKRLLDKAAAITAGELEEAICCIDRKDKRLNYSTQFAKYFNCELLSDEYARFCVALSQCEESSTLPEPNGNIAYLSNSYSNSALSLFLGEYTKCTAEPLTDFRACAEAVVSERCDYCLMPICSTEDGYFQSFRRLIKASELKIISKCTVSPQNTDNEMQFALLSKTCIPSKETQYIDFSFVPSDSNDFAAVTAALSSVGATICIVLSAPLEYNINKSEFSFTVMPSPGTAEAIAAFVESALSASSIDGAYQIRNDSHSC